MNEPAWGDTFSIHFGELELKAAIVSPIEAQRYRGEIYVLWDTAKEAKKSSDYTVGVAMKIFQKEDGQVAVVVLEVIFGKWTQTEIAYNMAVFNKKWMPKLNQVEDTGGLELLKIEVRNRSIQICGFPPNMYWRRPDQEDNAKRNRIKSLEILLKSQRLYFANGPWLEEKDGVFPQLMQYTGERSSKVRKDDIPDAMAHISRYLPSSAPMTPKEQQEKAMRDEQQYDAWLGLEQYRRMFGNDLPGVLEIPEMETVEVSTPFGSIAGRLFGGNGLRA
jgi:phage terminase large subunit-like protein